MKLFGWLYDRVMRWARHPHAPWYLSAVSFSEAIFFPVPVALMLLPMSLSQPRRAWRLAFITLIFSVAGGVVGYVLGWQLYAWLQPWLSHYAEPIARAREWFGEYGVWVVLMAGFSPVPYKIFTITAGSLSMAFTPFLLASIVARGAQFYLVAALVVWLGPSMEPKIRQYVEWIGWGAVVVIVAVLVYLNVGARGAA